MTPPVALDTHLPLALAEALSREGVDVVHLSHWHDGRLRTAADDIILAATTTAGRMLISRDAQTLPVLAGRWLAEGRHHAGIMILPKRIGEHDIGGALAAILHTLRNASDESLANTVTYAQRQR